MVCIFAVMYINGLAKFYVDKPRKPIIIATDSSSFHCIEAHSYLTLPLPYLALDIT
jgi:hypothetical protein